MKLWILVHHHRHGEDVFPVFLKKGERKPRASMLIEDEGASYNPDEGESAEWFGPFDVRKD